MAIRYNSYSLYPLVPAHAASLVFFVSFRQPTVIEIFTSSVEEDGSGSVRHNIRVTTSIRCGGLESEGNQMCISDDLVKDMLLE